jgi:hypothetical protein
MLSKIILTMAVSLALAACAGRDPTPVASVQQPQDMYSDPRRKRAAPSRIGARHLPHHEEGRLHTFRSEGLEHAVGVTRQRTIVDVSTTS